MDNYSTILFARPSFVEGMARIMDIGNTLNEYNVSLAPEQADRLALRADWCAIGADFHAAIEQEGLRPLSSKRKRRRAARNR